MRAIRCRDRGGLGRARHPPRCAVAGHEAAAFARRRQHGAALRELDLRSGLPFVWRCHQIARYRIQDPALIVTFVPAVSLESWTCRSPAGAAPVIKVPHRNAGHDPFVVGRPPTAVRIAALGLPFAISLVVALAVVSMLAAPSDLADRWLLAAPGSLAGPARRRSLAALVDPLDPSRLRCLGGLGALQLHRRRQDRRPPGGPLRLPRLADRPGPVRRRYQELRAHLGGPDRLGHPWAPVHRQHRPRQLDRSRLAGPLDLERRWRRSGPADPADRRRRDRRRHPSVPSARADLAALVDPARRCRRWRRAATRRRHRSHRR
jgi:hypothetical protein